ncbi:MAG: MurR/RpiR family transcriptional regulator [Eubacterium sp.]|nr:MurR/RpiR family transcriptional regulator [Eubacterium sp.]
MASLLSDIRTKYNTLSKNQKVIADYILENPDSTSLLSITELAGKCSTSETTVMRFLKKLDYDSYQIFRVHLAKELIDSPRETINEEVSADDDTSAIKRKVIAHTTTAIKDLEYALDQETIDQAVALILSSRRIYFFGVGASLAIAVDATHKFAKIGLDVCHFQDSHLTNIVASHMTPEDLIFTISHTGESMEVLNAISIAKKQGAKVIAMGSFGNSTMARAADVFLSSSTNDKRYHSEAMASRIVQLVIVDILYLTAFMHNEPEHYTALNDSRIAVSLNKT